MKLFRRTLGLLLAVVMLVSLIPAVLAATPGLSNFTRSRTYTPGQFIDVPESEWFAPNVKSAYELSLASGTGSNTFSPYSDMTAAMAVALAARLHAIYYTGSADVLVQGTPWYQVYVDYALANGILTEGMFSDYNAAATRAQCAVLLSAAIPAEELPAINTVEDGAIPDVSADSPYYEDIYRLYRAGILTGNDAKGTFTPDASINRVSMITIATRLVDKSLRRSVTLTAPQNTEPPIVIGHLADLTGIQALTGLLAAQAVDLAVKLINQDGGIAGRPVEVITVDCQSSASVAKNAAQTLIEKDKVLAILGPTHIGHKQAVASVAAEYEVPIMPYNGTPLFLTKKNEYFLSSGGGTAQMPTVMADYLYCELGLRKIYCIAPEGSSGSNYMAPLISNFIMMGGEVVGATADDPQYIKVPANATDISPYLLRVTEDADAIIGWLQGTQGVNLWTAWYDMGLSEKMPMYAAAHEGFTDYFIWKQLSYARPDVVKAALQQGVYAPVSWAYSIDNEANRTLVAAWEAEYGQTAPGSSLPGAGYTALLLLKNAIESIEGEVTGAAVYNALQSAACESAEGSVTFDSSPNFKLATKDIHVAKVVQLNDGTFNYQVVMTYEDVSPIGLSPLSPGNPVKIPAAPVEPDDTVTPVEPAEPSVPSDTEPPIVIGHLADLTGNEGFTGRLARQAVDFAVKQLNANGGINGRPVEVEHFDCQSSAQMAAVGVKTFEVEGVDIILAPLQAGHKEQAAQAAAKYGVPLLAYDEVPPAISTAYETLVAAGGGTFQMPTAMADYLYNKAGLRKIYCIASESALDRAYMEPFLKNFEALGGTVIETMWVPSDAMDVFWYLIRMNEEADAVVGYLRGTQGVNLWTAWYDVGLSETMPLYAAAGRSFTDYFIWDQLNNSRPEVVNKAMEWGVYAPVHWAYSLENEINSAFVQQWQDEFGAAPDSFGLAGRTYTALLLLKNAMESIDGEPTGETILAALKTASCTGPDGTTALNGTNVAEKDVYIAQVTRLADGTFNYKTVRTYTGVPSTGLYVARGALDSLGSADDPVQDTPRTAVSLLFNAGEGSICQNVNLRKAICYVIDNAAVATALTGQGEQADPIYGFQPYLPDSPSDWTSGRSYYSYNAKQILFHLNQAGYNGEEITILCTPELEKAANAVCSMLQACGINGTIFMLDRASYKVFCTAGGDRWDVRLAAMDDSTSLPEFFRTLHAAEAGGQNAFLTTDPELDAILAQWEADPSNTQLQELYDSRFTFEQCYGYGIYGYSSADSST